MNLHPATIEDANSINDLLNLAYRGEQGWTTEHHLVDGNRSVLIDIEQAIKSTLFLTYKNNDVLIGCICLEHHFEHSNSKNNDEYNKNETYIGSFAVHPDYQGKGVGKLLLDAAEQRAISDFNTQKLIMVVLSERTELIAFYERRGYKKSGNRKDFPTHSNVGTPKASTLTIEELYKII